MRSNESQFNSISGCPGKIGGKISRKIGGQGGCRGRGDFCHNRPKAGRKAGQDYGCPEEDAPK